MKYDFTTILDRKGKDSLAADRIPFDGAAVEEGFSTIPMWVADMSFPTAPFIVDAMRKRLEMPNFGYFEPSEVYLSAIRYWHETQKGVSGLTNDAIGYENGVLGGVRSAIEAFTLPGEPVLVHSPTYIGFTKTLESMGRRIVHSELVRDADGIWRMDYADMDRALSENTIHLAIFCSPHNPCGRVWERWEIEKAMDIYRKHDCVVISDEIWSDIVRPGYTHIPTQSVSEDAKMRTIAFYAPSKTFSLAGLVGSYHIAFNPVLRDRVRRAAASTHYNGMNVLSMHALTGAYSPEGAEWTAEMNEVIAQNTDYACAFLAEHAPEVRVMKPQGTYMLYLDCGAWCASHGVSIQKLLLRGVRKGVIWQNGEDFCMKDTIRMNLALPLELEKEAFDRLAKYAFCSRVPG